MTNIQHSSKSNEWYTPTFIIELVHEVIGYPDLDPASSHHANQVVKAHDYLTKEDNALNCLWSRYPVSVFLNPPGGKIKNKSQSLLFWEKLIQLRDSGNLREAIFLAFSIEQLAISQKCSKSLCDFTLVIPEKRIKFVNPSKEKHSPTHSNVIVYVPGTSDNTEKFVTVFKTLGRALKPY